MDQRRSKGVVEPPPGPFCGGAVGVGRSGKNEGRQKDPSGLAAAIDVPVRPGSPFCDKITWVRGAGRQQDYCRRGRVLGAGIQDYF